MQCLTFLIICIVVYFIVVLPMNSALNRLFVSALTQSCHRTDYLMPKRFLYRWPPILRNSMLILTSRFDVSFYRLEVLLRFMAFERSGCGF